MTIKNDDERKKQATFGARLIILRELLHSKEEPSKIIGRYSGKYSLSNEESQEMQSFLGKNKSELSTLLSQSVDDFISGKYLKDIQSPELIKYSYEHQKNNFISKVTSYIKQYGLKIPLHYEDDAPLFGENILRISFIETLVALEFEGLISIVSLGEGISKPHENTYEGWDISSLSAGYSKSNFTTFQVPVATIQLTGKLINLVEPNLSYESYRLSFKGKEIPVPEGDQDALCKVLFKDKKSMFKKWSWDEILENWGGNYEDKEAWRKVYNAGREINKKVAFSTTIDDLIVVKTKTTFVNPKYLPSQAK